MPETESRNDALDAARFRWLCTHWDDFTGYATKNPEKWLTETIDAAMKAAGVVTVHGYGIRAEIERRFEDAFFAQSHERQGERTHPNGLWMVYYEDASMAPEIFFGEGAEGSARLRYKHARDHWSCHLLSRVPTGDADSDRAIGCPPSARGDIAAICELDGCCELRRSDSRGQGGERG